MMTSFAGGLQFKNPISKSIGPGFDRPLCRQPNRSPYAPDYRDCVSEIKRNFRHVARPRTSRRLASPSPTTTYGRPGKSETQQGVGSRLTSSDLGQCYALLSLVLPAAVLVGGLANLVGLDEDDLGHALVGVDLGGQRRGVGELQRDVPLPLGLKRRDVDDDPAASVGRFPQADGEHAPGDAEVLDGSRQGEGVGRDDAGVAFDVHEGLVVEILRVDDGRVEIREQLEFIRATDVVTVARGAVGNDALTLDLFHLPWLERLDHAALGRHSADPLVRLDAHRRRAPQVFLDTTMFGNFEVMSLADSAILTASLRPIAL